MIPCEGPPNKPLRAKVLPLAEARGYLTDDYVFRELS